MEAKLIRLDELIAYPKNAKSHDLGSIHNSISQWGYIERIVVNSDTGHILSGHGRTDVLRQLKAKGNPPPDGVVSDNGHWMIPVDFVSVPESQEGAVTIALNRTVELGGWNEPALAELLQEVAGSVDVALESTGYDTDDLDNLLRDLGMMEEPPEDPGPQIDRAAELQKKWKVKRGDVWQIGKHRIMCGDSTCRDDVDRLMDGVKAQMMVTDPPYGVNYDQEWRSSNRIGKVTNDDNHNWYAAFNLFDGSILYVWCASWMLHHVAADIEQNNFDIRNLIIWNKSRLVMGRGHYHWKHEPCWYAVKSNATADWVGDRKQSTVWDINADDDVAGGHSTQKPVECMARPIRNHGAAIIYDPFLGSGTTLVACEQTGRVGFGMEIDPGYCSVTLERLSGLGLKPVRVEG